MSQTTQTTQKVQKTVLYIAKEHKDAVINTRPHEHDAGLDLSATETVVIPARGTALVPIGLRVTCIEGYWYTIHPRSSLAFKHSVTPMPGSVFDSTFTGNMDIKMVNISDKDYTITKGDRFAQIILHKVNKFNITEIDVTSLEDMFSDKRGDSKWGSSGK